MLFWLGFFVRFWRCSTPMPMQDPQSLNPYQAPRTVDRPMSVETSEQVYRDGDVLVARKGAILPGRCVRCNEEVGERRLKRKYSWHSPYWFLLLLIGPGLLIYLVVALLVCKTGSLEIGVCPRHRSLRRWGILIAWLSPLAAGAVFIAAAAFSAKPGDDWLFLSFLVGGLVLLSGLAIGMRMSQVLGIKRIDARYIWLTKAHPAFLADLPDFPGK